MIEQRQNNLSLNPEHAYFGMGFLKMLGFRLSPFTTGEASQHLGCIYSGLLYFSRIRQKKVLLHGCHQTCSS